VLETLLEVRSRIGSSLILIGHDLALQAQVADRVGIMFAGRLVEVGPVERIFDNPLHPYTRLLIAAVPSIRRQAGLPNVVAPSAAERSAWQAGGRLSEVEPGHLISMLEVSEAA
jgi:ABC-type dipeptide/oligopeptide/nickel transport system ATPase component